MIIEFIGLIFGFTVFFRFLNVFYSSVHFVGTIMTALFVGQ